MPNTKEIKTQKRVWEAIGTKEVAFDIIVTAKNKAEAIEKIRSGEVDSFEVRYAKPGFALSGGGDTGVKEVVTCQPQKK